MATHDSHSGTVRGVEREAQVMETECPHHPETPRTIQYDCVCCGRQEIVTAESYGLRSCSACQCIMQITILEEGKVIDWGRAKIRVLARRGIGVPVTVLPEPAT